MTNTIQLFYEVQLNMFYIIKNVKKKKIVIEWKE